MTLSLSKLTDAVCNAAAFRRVQRLQPVGGIGDVLFPPTYLMDKDAPQREKKKGPLHVFERRRLGASEVWTVLVDSVQSQANRLEEVLLEAADDGLPLPFVSVDFRDKDLCLPKGIKLEDLPERITSLDAPHRVYDAILLDSSLKGTSKGTPFMQSPPGERLADAKPADATALMEFSPNALLFGSWHSRWKGGGPPAKFPRVMVSEIIGVDVLVTETTGEVEPQPAGRRTGSRIDPLDIRVGVNMFSNKEADWNTTKQGGGGQIDPSKMNHGNVPPSFKPFGVTCAYAEHRVILTCAGLRRLRFGNKERNDAGRALLAALGLFALTEQDARGYCLRSRCDLVVSDGRADLEIVHPDGSTELVQTDRESAKGLYLKAYANAEAAGFRFKSLTLTPQPKLLEIIRQSREIALAGRGDKDTHE